MLSGMPAHQHFGQKYFKILHNRGYLGVNFQPHNDSIFGGPNLNPGLGNCIIDPIAGRKGGEIIFAHPGTVNIGFIR